MRGMVDIHCHIMPGVDDGADTRREVIEMLQKEYASGVEAIVLTPHHKKGIFETSENELLKRFAYVKKQAENMDISMKVYLGCEYYANSDILDELRQCKYLRMNGSKYVLIEFSPRHSYQRIRNWIYDLTNEGFCPIIAHMERYSQIVDNMEQVSELIDLGALVQVNSDAMLGRCGRKAKKIVKDLVKSGYVHFVASDAHDVRQRYPDLDLCSKYITRKWGKQKAKELLVGNPQMILKEMEEQEKTNE